MLKVSNLTSPRGNKIANQFEIIDSENDTMYFQSYDSIIAKVVGGSFGKVTLDKNYWDYSNTTRKYRNLWLGKTSQEVKERIKSGEYQLANLNS